MTADRKWAWTTDRQPFQLWDRAGRRIWQEDGQIAVRRRLRRNLLVRQGDIRRVESFRGPRWLSLGVRLVPVAGEPILLMRTANDGPLIDPTYDGLNLMAETSGIDSIARALAKAAGVSAFSVDEAYQDEKPLA